MRFVPLVHALLLSYLMIRLSCIADVGLYDDHPLLKRQKSLTNNPGNLKGLRLVRSETLPLMISAGKGLKTIIENRHLASDVVLNWDRTNMSVDILTAEFSPFVDTGCLCSQFERYITCSSRFMNRDSIEVSSARVEADPDLCLAACNKALAGYTLVQQGPVRRYIQSAVPKCSTCWLWSCDTQTIKTTSFTVQQVSFDGETHGDDRVDLDGSPVSCSKVTSRCPSISAYLVRQSNAARPCPTSGWARFECVLWSSKQAERQSYLQCPGIHKNLVAANRPRNHVCNSDFHLATTGGDLLRFDSVAQLKRLHTSEKVASRDTEEIAYELRHTVEDLLRLIDNLDEELHHLSDQLSDDHICPIVKEMSTGLLALYRMTGYSLADELTTVREIHVTPELELGTLKVIAVNGNPVTKYLDPRTGLILDHPCGKISRQVALQVTSDSGLLIRNGSVTSIPVVHTLAGVNIAKDFGSNIGRQDRPRLTHSAVDPAVLAEILPEGETRWVSAIFIVLLVLFFIFGLVLLAYFCFGKCASPAAQAATLLQTATRFAELRD